MTDTTPDPGPAPFVNGQNPDVAWAIEDIRRRVSGYNLYGDYYEGRHRLQFASPRWNKNFAAMFADLRDNLCDDVVDDPADRLIINGWTAKDRTLAQAATDLFEANAGHARFGQIHRDSPCYGDGFLMVWDDGEGNARFFPQDPRQCAVRYSAQNPDKVEVAAKVWRVGRAYRADLYYEDRLEHYASRGASTDGGVPSAKAFVLHDTDEAPAVEANPYGRQPMHHYPNERIGRYGLSVLRKVIPLQDILNKQIADMLVNSERWAMPKRWATGVEIPIDPVTGREKEVFREDDPVWWTKAENASVGQFPQADLAPSLAAIEAWRLEIARKGRLPAHSVTGTSGAPSGIALLVAEGRLIKWAKDAQRDFGARHLDAMAMALTIDGHGDVQASDLDLEWGPPETRDEKSQAETLVMKIDLGVSKRQALREMGYDEEKIDAMEAEREASAPPAEDPYAGGRMSALSIGDLTGAMAVGLPGAPQGPAGAPAPGLGR